MNAKPYLTLTWTDADTGAQGHLVVDRLVRGISSGGLRMRPGCTLDEVVDLARAMTIKEAIAYRDGDRYLPMGGAKGGIDFDPRDPRAKEVLDRYIAAMVPMLRERWSVGEDLGIRQDDLEDAVALAGLSSSVAAAAPFVADGAEAGLARIEAAFAVESGGIGLPDLVGGYGVAQSALATLEQLGRTGEATAVIQGFGSMGGATARYLAEEGVRVIGVADIEGVVVNPDGLDVEALLRTRDRHGRLDRSVLRPGDEQLPGEAWSTIACDVLVPAAASYVLTPDNAGGVNAAAVVEAANVATLAEAEAQLHARGIPVVPDFMANLATNAWWWWTLFGDVEPTLESAFAHIRARLRGLVAEAFALTADEGGTLREAGVRMSRERAELAAASLDAGPAPA